MANKTLINGIARIHSTKIIRCQLTVQKLFLGIGVFGLMSMALLYVVERENAHRHNTPDYSSYLKRESALLLDASLEPFPERHKLVLPPTPQKSTKLLLAFTTAYDEKSRKLRDTVRKTWLNYDNAWKGRIEYKFFLGKSPYHKTISNDELALGDMVFLNFIDTYENLSQKTMHLCKWATENYDFDYMAKMDDDTFLRLDRFVDFLIKNGSLSKFYAGKSHPKWTPTRDPNISKWAVTEKEFPGTKGPAWVQGFLYVLSYDSALFIGSKLTDPKYPMLKLEDVNTAFMMEEYGAKPVNIEGISIWPRCKEELMAMHYSNSTQMYQFYLASLSEDHDMCRNIKIEFET